MNEYNNSIGIKKSKKDRVKKKCSQSFIVRKLVRAFFNYKKVNEIFKNSAINSFITFIGSKFNYIKRIKKSIAKGFETSRVVNGINSVVSRSANITLRNLGVMTFFFGIFIVIFNAFRYVGNPGVSSYSYPVTPGVGVITVLVSLVMSFSSKCLGQLIAESRILSYFFFKLLNFDREKFVLMRLGAINNIIFAFIGVILGAVSAFVSPTRILITAFLLFIIIAVIKNPESGIILTCFLLPFLGENMLLLLVSICCISVLHKVLRNKRVLRFGVFDFSCFIFACCIFFSGLNGINGFESPRQATKLLLYFLFGWLLSNTIKTTILTKKCIKAVIYSVSIVSAIGIVVFIFDVSKLSETNIVLDYLNGIFRSIPFASDYSYAELAVIVLPFTLALMKKCKMTGLVCFVLCAVFAVLSMDISIWVSFILVLIIYFSVMKPRILFYLIPCCILLALAYFIFPDIFSFTRGFINNFSNHERLITSVSSANNFGLAAAREFNYFGSGVGANLTDHVFTCLFGSQSAAHVSECSLGLKILIQFGIFGIISIFGIAMCNMSNCFSLLYTDRFCKTEMAKFIVASVASVLTCIFAGIFFSIISSPNVILCVVIILYISISVRKSSEIEFAPEAYEMIGEEDY